MDLSEIEYKSERNGSPENRQKIKLKQLAYIRKLQYQMQIKPDKVSRFIDAHTTDENIQASIKELISPYKEGERYADLPLERIKEIFEQYKKYKQDNNERAIKELIELDEAENLKRGIVGNMIGVVSFLLEKYEYKAFISLENLCRAFYSAQDGITGQEIANIDKDFKEQENLVLAGLGTYQFFEMQLLKKLFKITQDKNIMHLVPPFRSVQNYEDIRKLTKEEGNQYVCKPFGIVDFVDPRGTSKKCPVCTSTNVTRNNKNNALRCKDCNFSTDADKNDKQKLLENHKKGNKNLTHISNADDNGAYHIALKTLKNKIKNIT